ncbi:MAG: hypothetical protein IT366_13330 [Candidatus Hydrogenedentes bacterium]|nr:hypothetical protein [Candidatus Hydrogenedentota bacterium]
MRVDFNETFPVPLEQAFSYFPTPHDWVRIFAFDDRIIDRGNGWYTVGLKKFPISLVLRVDIVVPNERVHWIFGGIWRGEGDVNFSPAPNGTTIYGFEEVHIPHMLGIGPRLECRYLQRPFERLWESGWKKLRRANPAREPLIA